MFIKSLAAAVLVVFALAPAIGEPATLSTIIVTSGRGTATASPDTAALSLSIETNDDSAARASSQNNTIYNRLVENLTALGIAKQKIRTTNYNMYYNPRPATEPVGYRQRYGYVVNRSLGVDLPNPEIAGKAIDAATSAGTTSIGGVEFSVADQTGLKARALQLAVMDARRHAEAMASAAGLHIKRVRQMQEGYVQAPVPMFKALAAAPGPAPPTEIPPGTVSVQATVTVTFEAQ